MAPTEIAAALARVETVLRRRPDIGLHDDSPATACWKGGTRVVASHANGTQVSSDLPVELGGTGDLITPGWLFRAGLASCLATTIAMCAAGEGIALSALEVKAGSRTDTRGMLGMAEADGRPVSAAPRDVKVHVRIRAAGVAPEGLRTLVEGAVRRSPIPCVLPDATPIDLHIDADAA